jgi:predicted nucleic acid-binding protein
MILVDTSVWVRHFRMGDKKLAGLLEEGEVSCHPDIIGELACGNLKRRSVVLSLLAELPVVPVAENDEVLALLDREKLYGRGLGWIDAHLLASAMLADCPIWTLDVSLKRAAVHLKIDFSSTDR